MLESSLRFFFLNQIFKKIITEILLEIIIIFLIEMNCK